MDQQLLFLINRQWTNDALDRFMAMMSSFAAWTPVLLVLAVVLLVRGGFRMRAFIVTAAAIVGINDGLVASPMKKLINRPRPHQALNDVRQVDLAKASPRMLALAQPAVVKLSRVSLEEVEGRSFPSGHTMNMFTAALVGVAFFGKRAWWGFVIAGLVGYSRIYTGAHWPSDVATTIFLALGSTLLLLALAERLWQRAGRRYAPALHANHPTLLAT